MGIRCQIVLDFLRMLMAEPDPNGRHKHQCEECGTVWEHSNMCAGDDDAHMCPDCGESQYYHYDGDMSVNYSSKVCESPKILAD
jgi:predicted RNA-binding Zn-ribbon protein involved in translation (DUF1610 family)